MIENGYRLHDGPDGRLRFDQIVNGRVYPLKPEPEDSRRRRGYYTPDFAYLGDDWQESQHPRGQPKNKGQFGPGGGGAGSGGGGSGSGGGGSGSAGGGVAGKAHLSGAGESYVRASEEEGQPKQHRLSKGGESYIQPERGPNGEPPPKPEHGGLTTKHRVKAAVAKAAGKVTEPVSKFGKEDYHIIREQVHAISSHDRSRMSKAMHVVAKSVPKLVAAHFREQKDDFVGAAGALRALVSGKRPSKAQLHGLKATGRTVLLAGFMMAATGGVGHAAEPLLHAGGVVTSAMLAKVGAAIAVELGNETVQHVILEHAAAIVSGAGRYAKHKLMGDEAGGPTTLPDDDMALLQQYAEAIAKSFETLDELDDEDIRAAMEGSEVAEFDETPDDEEEEGDGEEGDEEGDDEEDIDYPPTEDIGWR
jgi:hypothetical protein